MSYGVPDIVLASASPRRADILTQIGVRYTTVVSDIPEDHEEFAGPEQAVLSLSRRKAEDVAARADGGLVIGADTLVVLEDRMLGKPADAREAGEMLSALSGRDHTVYTGLTLVQDSGRVISEAEKTVVTFRELEPAAIDAYISTGAPFDKAGAYGIQDKSAVFIKKIDGCFYSVVGFPVALFYSMLRILYPLAVVESILGWGI